jgi:exopolysaccharide biosynthesis protein
MIVVDGRFPGDAEGMTIAELTELSQKLGLTEALNLDGGGSSTLWVLPEGVLNHPYDNHRFDHEGQRIVPNIIIAR